jgi:hypothetical protein
MADRLPPGPYKTLRLDDGTAMPFYVIPFDKKGRCEGPETRRHLIEAVRNGSFTNIFLFSHGWNNDWSVATERYEHFITGYMKMRRDRKLPVSDPYRPLLVGVFWPSTALVFGEKEKGPGIAAAGAEAPDAAVAEERREVREIAEDLPEEHVERFYELAQKPALNEAETLELARIVLSLDAQSEDETTGGASSAEDLVRFWKETASAGEEPAAAEPVGEDDFGTVDGGGAGPQAAGGLESLDPRKPIRMFTVWKMKDRAGIIGANGVGPLVRDLLAASQTAKLHLIGHSYGAKVVLSALASSNLPRPVESVLLLQPAVSHLCFADKVPTTDRPGGYNKVLSQVRRPILATFSEHDVPLTKVFHLAVRRADDLGELKIAAAGEPPSKFAALGGFGPRGAKEGRFEIKDPAERYDLTADGRRIFGIHASRTVKGHGDISNESTWWALYNLVS